MVQRTRWLYSDETLYQPALIQGMLPRVQLTRYRSPIYANCMADAVFRQTGRQLFSLVMPSYGVLSNIHPDPNPRRDSNVRSVLHLPVKVSDGF